MSRWVLYRARRRALGATMTNWEERINRGGDPAIVIEHVVRYRFAAPLLSGADLWIDAACGTGYAPSLLLGELAEPPRRALLADVDEAAVASAAGALRDLDRDTLVADLEHGRRAGGARRGDRTDRRAARRRSRGWRRSSTSSGRCRSCGGFAIRRSAATPTWCSACPNDAFWAMENPFHQTMWGEGAFDELRHLLPDHLAAAQFPINGSCITTGREADDTVQVTRTAGTARVPSHFLAAFGPRRDLLAAGERRHARGPPRPAQVGAAARGGSRVPVRRGARAVASA